MNNVQDSERRLTSNSLVFAGPYFGDLETEILRWVPYIRWLRAHYSGKHLAVAGYPGDHVFYNGIANEYWNLPEWFLSENYKADGFESACPPDIYIKLLSHFRKSYDGKFVDTIEVRPPRGINGILIPSESLFDKLSASDAANMRCRELLREKGDKPAVVFLAECGVNEWPRANWNQLLGMLNVKYADRITFVVGGNNITVPDYAIDINDFDVLARMDMTIAFLGKGLCSFTTQGGLAALSLHSGCASFIYGHQERRWGDNENPLKVPVAFFETTKGGYNDSPEDLFQDACAMIEDALENKQKVETEKTDKQHVGVETEHDSKRLFPEKEWRSFRKYVEKVKSLNIGMVGVFDVKGSTNIPFANAFEKAGHSVERLSYRTGIQTLGSEKTSEAIVELSSRVDLMIFCKGNGIISETMRKCSENTTTCWYMMDACSHLKDPVFGGDYVEFANICEFSVVTYISMKESLEAAGVTRPIYHMIQGIDPSEFHPVEGIEKIYDVGFIGIQTEKRDAILDAIHAAGFTYHAWGQGYADGAVTGEDFNRACAQCRIMIATNNTDPKLDGFSDRIVRYMATGACVLSEATKNIGTYFKQGTFSVFNSTEEAVAKATILLRDFDDKIRSERGAAARQHVVDNYTWGHVVDGILDIAAKPKADAHIGYNIKAEDQLKSPPVNPLPDGELIAACHPGCGCPKCMIKSKAITIKRSHGLNIGFVTQWFERGQAYVTQMLRNAVIENGHNAYVLARNTTNNQDRLMFSNAEEFKVPNVTRGATYMINLDGFRQWIEAAKLDIVFFNEEPQIELVQCARGYGAKTVGYFVWELLDPQSADLIRTNYDIVISQTDAMAEHWKRLGVDNAVRIRWGIDRDFEVQHTDRPPGQPITFFHPAGWGGLHKRRGTQYVIDAFKMADIPNARLRIHEQQDGLSEEKENITIERGIVSRKEMVQMYQDCDVVVLPSKWEGLGLPYLEAIGARKPVITVDAPPMNEFVSVDAGVRCRVAETKDYDGIFVPGQLVDVRDLADAMFQMMNNDTRNKMVSNLEAVAESYSFDGFSKQIDNMVMNLQNTPEVQAEVIEKVTRETMALAKAGTIAPVVAAATVAAAEPVKKIKIFWTSEHCCIRVIKLALALMRTGRYEIHHAARQQSWGAWLFDKFSLYHNKKQLENLLRDSNADLFIHSNEPCWQLNEIRKIRPNDPILLDAHDLDSIRQGFIPIHEQRALTNCDGVLFPSVQCQEYIVDLHKEQLRDKPTAALEHYCSSDFVNDRDHDVPIDQRIGLIYQGGAQPPPYKNPMYRYRQLYDIFKQIVDQGNEVHLVFGNPDATVGYNNIGAFVHQRLEYNNLILELRKHRWGMVVFNNGDGSQLQVNLTRTNKEQEYLTAGMPLIVFGAPATAEYVKHYDIGLVFDKLEDIRPEVLDAEYDRLRVNVEKLRPGLTMESHIHRLEDLIKKMGIVQEPTVSPTPMIREKAAEKKDKTPSVVTISHGAKMLIESQDRLARIQSHWLKGVFYEQEMLDYIHSKYNGGTFIDVGSSVGNHVVYFALYCKPDKIISFEPVKSVFEHQRRNLELNGIGCGRDKIVKGWNVALGEIVGRGDMELPEGGNEGEWVFKRKLNGSIEMNRLDDFEIENVTLIKIDAEGCELDIIKGGIETIRKYMPAMFVEAKKRKDIEEILRVLSPIGYVERKKFNATPTYELTVKKDD